MKKVTLISVLTLALFGASIGTGVTAAFAEQGQAVTQNEAGVIEQEREKLEGLEDKVAGTDYEDALNQLIPVLDNLEQDVNAAANKARFNMVTIYDLDSIGVRLQLITEISNAIAFSVEQLGNKVEQAHRELGVEITKAVITVADPFASVSKIEQQIVSLQNLMEKVLTYPDLDLNAKATYPVKQKLDAAIWATRFERDKKILGKVPFAVYNDLNKVITRAVGVQLSLKSTVGDVNAAIQSLENALELALSFTEAAK
ncbi:CAMP factor family pore-forming toxin [Enterococcus sp. BWM-S5]|uniref:cAMP factor family pore-forming toxin n=1 Tax=Enterococcus larvae TaxID=2794352 RepID=A0ABS4CEN9_9ENTE|nr:CAMP factor family pore-forming toxin [Enterococcus larvae]MBP1044663.1 CAMP factor family pore-forming toxin [Enterococcus larvae]